ncbi:MAG: methyltransferase domain-containing protein [Leptolyngbyaceae cyanobacterium CSU_1_3]|nr:methyltransferase domain-containing protein [Leptolyngbyaceae cyanobacterium CSU_1_3]
MTNKTINLTDTTGQLQSRLYDYLLSTSLREPEILTQLRQRTAQLPEGDMQISPDQGQFMALLVQLMGAKKILEIGTFTGYSTLWIALALPGDGTVIACDINEDYTAIAHQYWQTAGVSARITLHLAPALDTLDQLLEAGQAGTFDFVFIDAEKTEYDSYYEKSLQLLRVGGLIVFDNALWQGFVANPEIQDESTVAIRRLNQKIHQDQRVSMSLIAIGDGLLLACKH